MRKFIALTVVILLSTSMFSSFIGNVAAASSVSTVGQLPLAICLHSAIWDGQYGYIFGGGDATRPRNTIIRFDPSNNQATVLPTSLPDAITDMGVVYDGTVAYLFSGWTDRTWGNSGKIVRFNPATGSVTEMQATLSTWSMSAVWNGEYAYLFGGWNGYSYYDQILRYDPVQDLVMTMNAKFPIGIKWTSAVWTGTYAYIFGGSENYDNPSNHIYRYDPTGDTLTQLPTTLPSSLQFNSAVWTGEFVYIFGGGDHSALSDKILKFDPLTEAVTVLSDTLPTARWETSAIWNGKAAYVFGGHDGSAYLSDIIKFAPVSHDLPEVRGIFVRPSRTHLFWGVNMANVADVKARIEDFVSEVRESNLNAIFVGFKNDGSSGPNFVSGETFYDSKYATINATIINPDVAYLLENNFDVMSYLIAKAHENDIEVHAWIPVFNDRVFIENHGQFGYSGEVRQRLELKIGRWILWKAYSQNFVDPAIKSVRDYEMSIVNEIISKYPLIDGINLDYVRYTDEWLWGVGGYLVVKDPPAIVDFIAQVSTKLSANTVLSADVYTNIDDAKRRVGQDIVAISKQVDAIMPMAYGGLFEKSVNEVVSDFLSRTYAKYVVPCLKAWDVTSDQVISDIKTCRTTGADGFALFHYSKYPKDKMITLSELLEVLPNPADLPW